MFNTRVLLLLTAITASAASRLDINRLYSLPWIIGTAPKDFAWSADSRHLAFLWNDQGNNFRDVWTISTDSTSPVRLTHMAATTPAETDTGVSHVTWSNNQLLFIFKGQLYIVKPGDAPKLLVSRDNVTAVKVAPAGDQVAFLSGGDLFVASKKLASSVEDFYWSNDGKSLAFIESDESKMPRRGIPDYLGEETVLRYVKRPFPGEPSELRRLGIISADGTTQAHWADLGPDHQDLIFGVSWSPDGKSLLVDKSDLYIKHRRMLLVNPNTGASSLLLREDDPKNVTAEWWSDWAPDGKGVYFTSDRDNDYQIYYMALHATEPKPITSGNWAVFDAAIPPKSNSLFFTSNEGKTEERHLYKLPLSGGAPQRVTQTPGTHTATVSPDGSYVADYFSNDLTPPDLYLIKNVANAQQVTHSPLPDFSDYQWVAARYVTFPSTADGVTLHGRLTLPPDFDRTKKYPAILGSVYSNTVHNQWGGRVAHPTWGLDQYLAQQGYILLNVDIRGSSGYGKAFRQRLALDYGGIDVEDLYSGVKFLESEGYVDMQRVGIWGSSYGGLLTTTSLFTKPGVYKAGVAGAPATSLFHALTGEMRTMMAPQDHQQAYAKASAFLKSDGLQDHLMIIHGMRDDTVLFKDSVTLEQRLIMEGKDIQLVVLPNAPHSWDTGPMVQTRYAYNQLIDFFKQYLGN